MRIYKVAQNKESVPNNGIDRTITAYHGTNEPFYKFENYKSALGVFWFSDDMSTIISGDSGATSSKYIMKVVLSVKDTASWDEYEELYLAQLGMEFDSINLDNDWVIFDPNRVSVKEVYQRMDDGSYEDI